MRYIISQSLDPAFNQAQEEYFLKHSPFADDLMIFWITEPTCLLGKNQNTLEEINEEYVRSQGLHVVRRLSGGGCIYMDEGNLLFTFITENRDSVGPDFERFTRPVAAALQSMGIPAEVSGRNDILIGGRKFSGNAQYYYRNRVLHHGSMLYSTNLGNLALALKSRPDKMASKGVRSVRSRVTRIADHLENPWPIGEFRDRLIREIVRSFGLGEVQRYEPTPEDLEAIEEIAEARFRNWDWNYGHSPRFSLVRSGRYPGGGVEFHLDVDKGRIREARIFGDFFSRLDISGLEEKMQGLRFERKELETFLSGLRVDHYFGTIQAGELLECLFPPGASD